MNVFRFNQGLAEQNWNQALSVAQRHAADKSVNLESVAIALFQITEKTQTSLPFLSICIQIEVVETGWCNIASFFLLFQYDVSIYVVVHNISFRLGGYLVSRQFADQPLSGLVHEGAWRLLAACRHRRLCCRHPDQQLAHGGLTLLF